MGRMSALGRSIALAAPLWAISVSHADQPPSGPLWRGADPWLIRNGNHWYSCNAAGRTIEVWASDRLGERGRRVAVWTAPRDGWNRDQIWAPELHRLGEKWYIYYAASRGENATHRMGVLESRTGDPQGEYIDRGALYTGDDPAARHDSRWAIDGTVLSLRDQLYFVWSGWEDNRDVQHLYIARMKDPVTIPGARVRICANNTHRWERVGDDPRQRGLHEGPAILRRGGRIFLVYSCSGSWQPTYKLGMLWASEKDDPMNPRSWTKLPQPVFESTPEIFGVGHCSFTTSLDGRQDFLVYHSKRHRREGWEREVRMQRFSWTEDGFPDFGRPVQRLETRPAAPAGR